MRRITTLSALLLLTLAIQEGVAESVQHSVGAFCPEQNASPVAPQRGAGHGWPATADLSANAGWNINPVQDVRGQVRSHGGSRIAAASPAALTHADDRDAAVASAMATLDAFMAAFNGRDMSAWAATLHYPHVRFASGTVRIWPDAESFAAESPFEALAAIGWDRSRWASREVRLMDPDKVHIETVFERLDANGEVLWTFPSLYIVTRNAEGNWGVQARSSLAP